MKNKSAREQLEKIYGKKCMCCKGIRKVKPPKPKKTRFKGQSIANQLTYHHIKPKSLGGETNINNGAVLCRSCHTWLEELPESQRQKVNYELIKFKESKCQVVFVDDVKTDYVIIPTTFSVGRNKKKAIPYDRNKKKREDKEKIEEYLERD